MDANNSKPKSLDEVLASIESRGMAWKRHIEKHARVGESWEAADARLRRESGADRVAAPVRQKPPAAEVKPERPPKKSVQPAKPERRKRSLPRLLPDRAQQQDFFVADIFDAELKDDMASMEHPLFALRAGDKRPRIYERKGFKVSVLPGFFGCATIYDKDLWIYCISQLVEAKNKGEPINRIVHFRMYDFLKVTNRRTDGDSYKRAAEMMERLKGTVIQTDIEVAGYRERQGFGLVDSWRVVERDGDNRMVAVEVTLSNWLFASIEAMQVLTLSRDYFRIRKALDRRIYELARKHCGAQASWTVSIKSLHEKSGSSANLREFRRKFKELAKINDLPDYRIRFDEQADAVTFYASGKRGYQAELQKLMPDLAGRFGVPPRKERKKRSK